MVIPMDAGWGNCTGQIKGGIAFVDGRDGEPHTTICGESFGRKFWVPSDVINMSP